MGCPATICQPRGRETEPQDTTWQSTLASQSVIQFIMPTTDVLVIINGRITQFEIVNFIVSLYQSVLSLMPAYGSRVWVTRKFLVTYVSDSLWWQKLLWRGDCFCILYYTYGQSLVLIVWLYLKEFINGQHGTAGRYNTNLGFDLLITTNIQAYIVRLFLDYSNTKIQSDHRTSYVCS